jgi:hypothetical protein
MWNRELKFSPAEILGLLVLVEYETEPALRYRQPVGWVGAPYDLIPGELLVYESFRLMHTLVTDTQPKVWHNVVEEALLYLRIDDHYFDVAYRHPTARELQRAQAIFREILARARAGGPADGLEWIPPLHQT